jgi:hypothetical protein
MGLPVSVVVTTAPVPAKKHTFAYIGIAIFGIALIVIIVYIIQPAIIFPNVLVSGDVQTSTGTTPTGLTFTSESGQVITASVVSGQYSASLPNGHTYRIVVTYSTLDVGAGQSCTAQSFSLNIQGTSYTLNVSC